jgi:predicted dehydrogenase
VKVGIIGTNWGLMHVGGFRGAGAEVVGLCGRQPDKTRHTAAREGIPLATVDPAELCAASDVVVVAGPDALHARHVRIALDHARPVLCEKPLATSEADAARMAAWACGAAGDDPGRAAGDDPGRAAGDDPGRAAGASGAPLCAVNFPYRALPAVARLRERLGGRRVELIACTVENSFAGAATEASGDLGGLSHLIDTGLWLAGGAPRWVQAALTRRTGGSAALQVGLDGGALLVITQVAASRPGIRGTWSVATGEWDASFSAGYAPERGGWCVSPLRIDGPGGGALDGEPLEPAPGRREPWAEAHVAIARHFLAALAGGDRGPLADFGDGLAVQRVLAAAVRSHEQRARVGIPRAPPDLAE